MIYINVKVLFKSIYKLIKNNALLEELENKEQLNKEKVKMYESENMKFEREIKSYKEQMDNVIKTLNPELDEIMREIDNLSEKDKYDKIAVIDPEEWKLYWSAKEILNIDIHKHFFAEDMMGRFELSDGKELLTYIEAAAFGEKEWEYKGCYEIMKRYELDENSDRYKKYLKELFPLANKKLIKDIYKLPPEKMIKFIRDYKDNLLEEALEKDAIKDILKESDIVKKCSREDFELEL